MKTVKTILLVCCALLLLVVGGLFIFINSIDLNQYLPQITKTASEAMGRQLSVGRAKLSLTFQGVALKCDDIQIKGLVDVKSANAGVEFWPLLTQHKIDFKNILVNSIDVTVDDPKMPLHIHIPLMKASVTDFSLTDPYHVSLDFVLASAMENMHLTAKVQLDAPHGKIVITDLVFSSNLSQLDMSLLRNISPALAKAVLPTAVSGDLNVRGALIAIGSKGLEGLQAHLLLENAGASLKEIPTPITKARVDAELNMTTINALEFHAHIGEGSINGQGQVINYLQIPTIVSKGNIDAIKIEDIVDQSKAPVFIKGKIVANGSLNAQTFDPVMIMKTLKGQGEFSVVDGVVEKLNIAKAVLGETLEAIPGLAESLDNLIAGVVSDKLGADATVLDKAYGRFSVENGMFRLEQAQAVTKAFELNAQGSVGLEDLNTDMPTAFLLTKDISDAISKKVEQLGYLRDESGRIKIAGQVQGKIPNLVFKPNVDIKQATKNAVIEEGGKQLEKVIEKNPQVGEIIDSIFGRDPATQEQNGNVPQSSGDKAKRAIGNVLNSILK